MIMMRSFAFLSLFAVAGSAFAQQAAQGVPVKPLGPGPFTVDAAEKVKLKVSVVARGLSHPWSLAFLPDGNMLVTERAGKLRIIRKGVLDSAAISGVPSVHAVRLSGFMDVALHPKFSENHYVYFTYTKDIDLKTGDVATTLGRGRLEGNALVDVKDLLVGDIWPGNGGSGSRIMFDKDGSLFMTTGASNGNAAQEYNNTRGKVLRLTDEGKAAPGNPFAGRADARAEVYSMGHRNPLGLAFHPVTGELWSSEMGPNGGDEINIIRPGRNYGWPIISYGRTYEGPPVSEIPWKEGMTGPWAHFVPGISPSGLAFYTGDKIPQWKNNLFVGGMRQGQIQGTAQLIRIFVDENGNERRRESLLKEIGQRIRDIRTGPDGYLYLLTDEDDGAVLKLELAQ
jgi:glucose/arabinose dehydrogenase